MATNARMSLNYRVKTYRKEPSPKVTYSYRKLKRDF